jgi:hypothetical protein
MIGHPEEQDTLVVDRTSHDRPTQGRLVAEVPLVEGRAVLRLVLRTFNGCDFLDIRRWERYGDGGLGPTKKGVTIATFRLKELLAAVRASMKAADDGQPPALEIRGAAEAELAVLASTPLPCPLPLAGAEH